MVTLCCSMSILNDPAAAQYVAGSGWHCYAGDRTAPGTVRSAHPDKDIYFTECSGGEWDTNFGSEWLFYDQENHYIRITF